jgi:signal transduction histidine kinase
MTPEDIKDIIISMKTDATNVYKLLENLLEWSRLKRGSMEFNPIRLNLQKIINESVGDIAALARKKQIEIEVSVAGDIELSADAHMFQAVVRNLISNSVKFTPSGGKVTIKAVRKPEGMTEISVSDTGIGMTEEMKGKLFKMNEKTSRTGTEGELSTGLGLLLCKEFVEKHRGTIFVESEKGKGSTFCFTIPEL